MTTLSHAEMVAEIDRWTAEHREYVERMAPVAGITVKLGGHCQGPRTGLGCANLRPPVSAVVLCAPGAYRWVCPDCAYRFSRSLGIDHAAIAASLERGYRMAIYLSAGVGL